MEVNSWRPAQGDPITAAADWRGQLQLEERQEIVNQIMETLKWHLPIWVPEGLNDLHKIAVRFEEKIYSVAPSQVDYRSQISQKMLSMESKAHPAPASVESTAQTGPAGGVDWQEEIYQKIISMKELYYADLSELYHRIVTHDALMPPGTLSEQYDKMKNFKIMLERTLAILKLNKGNIQVGLKDKLPLYEKQIVSILASHKKETSTAARTAAAI